MVLHPKHLQPVLLHDKNQHRDQPQGDYTEAQPADNRAPKHDELIKLHEFRVAQIKKPARERAGFFS